jgi:D-glycero-D-manno-heptose 1,7-bisphosphate phosphatase
MKLVILDRDGTINVRQRRIHQERRIEWTPLPGALEAVARLNHAGWHVAVASNQSGLGRGLFDVASLNAMHAKMHKMLAAVGAASMRCSIARTAPTKAAPAASRKPGLFEQIGERFGIDLKGTPTCGRQPARPAGRRGRGCEPHLVLTGKGAACRGVDPLPSEPTRPNTRCTRPRRLRRLAARARAGAAAALQVSV